MSLGKWTRGGVAAQYRTVNATVVGSIPIRGCIYCILSFPRSGYKTKCI